ncbi:MAG: hypothetical protein ACYDC1_18960 [Limisphaerales bacterium]
MNRFAHLLRAGLILGGLELGGGMALAQEDEEGPPPLNQLEVIEPSEEVPEPIEEPGAPEENEVPMPVSVANAPESLREAADAAAAFERMHAEAIQTEVTPPPAETSLSVTNVAPSPALTVSTNPYQAIVARNPFGLRSPPPPAPPPEVLPQVVPSALKLTGVTTLLGGKRAMFSLQEPGKTNVVSDLVREGDWDTMITNLQVLNIDERAGVVKVAFGGRDLELDFENNGIKPPAAPLLAGQPGGAPMPMVPGFVPPRPGQRPMPPGINSGINEPGGGIRQIPTRPNRMSSPVESSVPVLTPQQQLEVLREQEILGREAGVPMPPAPPVPGASGGEDAYGDGPPPLPVPPPRRIR